MPQWQALSRRVRSAQSTLSQKRFPDTLLKSGIPPHAISKGNPHLHYAFGLGDLYQNGSKNFRDAETA